MSKTIGEEVPVDEANQYIGNFLANYYETGKVPVKSHSIDANLLREYLISRPQIANMKLMLAERPDEDGTMFLTQVLVGYDVNGDYVLTMSGKVLDYCAACPPRCPAGAAANDYITTGHTTTPPSSDESAG